MGLRTGDGIISLIRGCRLRRPLSRPDRLSRIEQRITMNSGTSVDPNRSVSGKVFVVPFAILILFLLWLVFSIAVRFQTIMTQMDQTRTTWPATVAKLNARYDAIEQSMKTGNVTTEPTSTSITAPAAGEPGPTSALLPAASWDQFKRLRTESKRFSQFEQQSVIISQIENLLDAHAETKLPDELKSDESVRELLQSEKERDELQSGFVGRSTMFSLRLQLPPIFSL